MGSLTTAQVLIGLSLSWWGSFKAVEQEKRSCDLLFFLQPAEKTDFTRTALSPS